MAAYPAQLRAFCDFLLAYAHTLLCLRALYPPASFARARFHNTPVHQSRHPAVCAWLRDAVAQVHRELLAGTVARIGIAVYCAATARVLERYMFDVSGFPRVAEADRQRDVEWEPRAGDGEQSTRDAPPVDMAEQFRAALVLLNTRCAQLAPLPAGCSFNVCMELKDDAGVDAPIQHPQQWIPVQASLQKSGRKGAQAGVAEGEDLGGVRVTPIRTVEAGVLRFETWIEEGRAKLDLDPQASASFSSTATG